MKEPVLLEVSEPQEARQWGWGVLDPMTGSSQSIFTWMENGNTWMEKSGWGWISVFLKGQERAELVA